jgi:hypothetical protein
VDVLSIHGIQDQTVPVWVSGRIFLKATELTHSRYDALIYARALADRSPGTHNLHLVEGADHNFTEVYDVHVICI